jgi:cyanophycin synthetase
MDFRKVLALRGPNVWANFPVLEAWVDLGALRDTASSEMPGFNDRLKAWLPTLVEHRCSVGRPGGFFERLDRGTYLAHILEHVALELQTLAGSEAGFGRTRQVTDDGLYKVAVEYEFEELGRACLDEARDLCLAAVHDQPFEAAAAVGRLKAIAARCAPPPAEAAVRAAARSRRVPVITLPGGVMQLGYGRAQRRMLQAQTDATSAVGTWIVYDRDLARTLLADAGVPVPAGRTVTDADDAVAAAGELGFPVVVKPQSGYRRHDGVRRPCLTADEVRTAYATAREWRPAVIVEKAAPGGDYQLLVAGGKVIDAARRDEPADVTALVHAEVAARAVEAAAVIGLDIAGVDVVCANIAQPLEGQGGVVAGVRANPALGAHLKGKPADTNPVGEAIVAALFPNGATGRVPVVAVTGTNGKTTTTRLIARLLESSHGPVGMTCTEGIYLGDRRLHSGDCSGPKSARCVLQHTLAGAAVLETARGGILREGLGFDRCDVAVITNIGEGDHLGTAGIETAEQLAYVKSTLVAAVTPATGVAVLNAADALVVDMARYCKGSVTYFALDEQNEVIAAHRAAGGRAVFVRDNHVVLAEGMAETTLVDLEQVPLTHGGKVLFHVENTLAAVAAAWALGVPAEPVRAGLASFGGGLDQAPARFNLLDIDGVTVVLDYGHNVDALARLIEALAPFPHEQRTAVYSAAGDRRDADMVRQGEQLGNAFDRVVLYEDTYLRGREGGEIFRLFREGLAKGNRVREVLEIRGGLTAVEEALAACKAGELLFIQPDIIDDTVAFLKAKLGSRGRELHLEDALTPSASSGACHGTPCGGVVVKEGSLGKSAHAGRAFRKGEPLLSTWGRRVARRTRHSIQVDDHCHVVADGPLIFFNHSCEPNCGLLIRRGVECMEVHALRPLEPGEELTLDYATFEYEIRFMSGPCLCGTAGCRGTISGYKSLPRERRKAYGVYVAEYLRHAEEPAAEKPLVVAAGRQ